MSHKCTQCGTYVKCGNCGQLVSSTINDKLLLAARIGLTYINAVINKMPRPLHDLQPDKELVEAAIAEAKAG